ncbi:MAG TPA: DNA mismatch repair endonuclease MutL, partial [Armatimonadota bacterium]|nr:DNA mismatch repair endonuclease MutL [Armatimonadota bacterium]
LTRTPGATEGTRVVVEGGIPQSEGPAAAQVGTSITVRRLFFNVPVREKFLRSDVTEAAQITEWLQRLALSRPDVSFRLVHDGREALLSPGTQDPLNAVVAILGRGVARELLRVPGAESGEVRVSGFVGRPTLTRANRGLQHFYVNGRAVRSPILFRAVDDAFRATMPQKRYPAVVLFVDLPADAVDVNVHPAKTEVRFQDEDAVYSAALRGVQAALRMDADHTREPDLPLEPAYLPEAPPPSLRVAEPPAPPAAATALPFAEEAIGGPSPWQPRGPRPGGVPPPRPEPGFRWTPPAPRDIPSPAGEPSRPPAAGPLAATGVSRPAVGDLKLLGQAQDLFILAEEGGRFWIIDQHVAHERVLFDRMTAPGAAPEPSEALLIPAAIDVDRAQALALEDHLPLLAELG